MSLTTTGYVEITIDDMFNRIYNNLQASIGSVTVAPDNILYQYAKAITQEFKMHQDFMHDVIENINPLTASGYFLRKIGYDMGIFEKKEAPAYGDLYITVPVSEGAISAGSTFSTILGVNYTVTTEVPYAESVTLKRTSGLYDNVPLPYTSITDSGIYDDIDLDNRIESGYYTIINDQVLWNINQTGYFSAGTEYYMAFSGNYTLVVPIECENNGYTGNTPTDTIVVNTNNLSDVTSLTNPYPFINGRGVETDEDYRARVLGSTNKSFTLKKIQTLINSLDEVRTCTVKQSLGLANTLLTDWTKVSECTGIAMTGQIWYGAAFPPSGNISSIGQFTLYGKVTGENPPNLEVYLKAYVSGDIDFDTGYYLANSVVSSSILQRDHEEELQNINIPINYAGMDSTLNYIVMWRHREQPTGSYWVIAHTGYTPPSYRYGFFSGEEQYNTTGFAFKTYYKAPGYNVEIIPEDGYVWEDDVVPAVDAILGTVDEGGYSPVGIQYVLNQTTKTYMGLSATIYIYPGYDFESVKNNIVSKIGVYLQTFGPGDEIVYSQIEKIFLNENGLKKVTSLKIGINSSTLQQNKDIYIEPNEYVGLDIYNSYQGISIIKG
jgi:uncharacterized phage protein gp47/JayE